MVADPPGPKIGNGGATLVALEMLEARIGARLDERIFCPKVRPSCTASANGLALPYPLSYHAPVRVLIIHTGGFSKRLPHVSAGGKVFAALPIGTDREQITYIRYAVFNSPCAAYAIVSDRRRPARHALRQAGDVHSPARPDARWRTCHHILCAMRSTQLCTLPALDVRFYLTGVYHLRGRYRGL